MAVFMAPPYTRHVFLFLYSTIIHITEREYVFRILKNFKKSRILKMPTNFKNKYARLRGRPYIHTCRSYAWPARTLRTPASAAPWLPSMARATRAICAIWGFWGAMFLKMGDSLPLTPLALSSAEISITVQTHKKKQTVTVIGYPHLAYRHLWIINSVSVNISF